MSDALSEPSFTVLVVDDDPSNLRVIVDYLGGLGFQVATARDGETGLERARLVRPDIILLDVRMPGIDGIETCRRLKADPGTGDVPVIFLTALDDVEHKVAGFGVGGVDYVSKPLQMEEVLARVRTHLRLRTLTRELQEMNATLAQRVAERSAALARSNQELQAEVTQRQRAEEQTRLRNRELTLLNRIITASVTEVEEAAILEIACREIVVALGLTRCVALLLERDANEATVVAERSPEGLPPALGLVVSVVDQPDAKCLLRLPTPTFVADVRRDPRVATLGPLEERLGAGSLLVVPLLMEGGVIGALCLSTQEPRDLPSEEVELAQSVAHQVAGGVVRLRMNEQRKQLQAQYYQSQKMEAIGQLAGGIAHDFNNILVPILAYVDLAMMSLAPESPLSRDLLVVRDSAERAAKLTRQILAYGRKQMLEMRVLDLNRVVEDFRKLMERLIGEDIEVSTFLDPALRPVKADRVQIEQVLLNLVVNARDAMPNGGKLVIETGNAQLDEAYVRRYAGALKAGSYVMLAVSDTGHGMDQETQQRIFQPFFTTKAPGRGTGLGLATVFGIVRQHAGNVWVYSEPGKGATFKVYLPQAEGAAKVGEVPVELPESTLGTETILVVEDDDMVRRLVCETLTALGYLVLEASRPSEALRIASQHFGAIDLLLTDVIMPEMNGRELHRAILAHRRSIRVLYMSGYTDNVIVHHGVLDEGVTLLQKPFRVQELGGKVRMVLAA